MTVDGLNGDFVVSLLEAATNSACRDLVNSDEEDDFVISLTRRNLLY